MNYEEKWKAERERTAFLALDDGTVFHGVAFGAKKDALGEVVFNTGMSGYQEILTDPSYAGQFVTLTTAEVGNYGINPEDVESRGFFCPDSSSAISRSRATGAARRASTTISARTASPASTAWTRARSRCTSASTATGRPSSASRRLCARKTQWPRRENGSASTDRTTPQR